VAKHLTRFTPINLSQPPDPYLIPITPVLSILIPNLQRKKLTPRKVKTFAGGQINVGASTQIQVCLTRKSAHFLPYQDSGDLVKYNGLSNEGRAAKIRSWSLLNLPCGLIYSNTDLFS